MATTDYIAKATRHADRLVSLTMTNTLGNVQPMQRTAMYDQVEEKLRQPLADYVAERRASGASWRRIALSITESTGIDITGEALRVWFVLRQPQLTASP